MMPSSGGLSRAVAVVEQVLALGVVDRDHRELQLAFLIHRPQPDDAGGRLFHAGDDPLGVLLALHVHFVDQVGPVVERDHRLVVDGRVDVLVVGRPVLAANGKDGNPKVLRPARPPHRPACSAGWTRTEPALAPPAFSVRTRLAVSAVMCRHAEMFLPLSGLLRANRSRIAARTGMSLSAHRILRFPSDANAKSATSYFIHESLSKSPVQTVDSKPQPPQPQPFLYSRERGVCPA